MGISVYVAGSSAKMERARAFMELVQRDERMRLTHNWVAKVDALDMPGARQSELSNVDRAKYANEDLDAVAASDVLVVLAEAKPSGVGMWVELGYALAINDAAVYDKEQRVTIIVSGGDRRSIFTAAPQLADFEVPYSVAGHDGEAFAILRDISDSVSELEEDGFSWRTTEQ